VFARRGILQHHLMPALLAFAPVVPLVLAAGLSLRAAEICAVSAINGIAVGRDSNVRALTAGAERRDANDSIRVRFAGAV